MNPVDGAALQRLKQFASRDDLVGLEQFNLQLPVCSRVALLDDRLRYLFLNFPSRVRL